MSAMRQPVPRHLPLFRSEDQLRLLGILLLEPRKDWSVDELAAATGAPRPSVHRELQRAVAAGLVDRDASARPHRFRANTHTPLYSPLRDLLELTVGLESELRNFLEGEEGIDAAIIHGSWAGGTARLGSDVDVLAVGEPDLTRLRRQLRDIGRRAGRRIDVTAFSPAEFARRRAVGDGFLEKILAEPHIVLVGDPGVIRR